MAVVNTYHCTQFAESKTEVFTCLMSAAPVRPRRCFAARAEADLQITMITKSATRLPFDASHDLSLLPESFIPNSRETLFTW